MRLADYNDGPREDAGTSCGAVARTTGVVRPVRDLQSTEPTQIAMHRSSIPTIQVRGELDRLVDVIARIAERVERRSLEEPRIEDAAA